MLISSARWVRGLAAALVMTAASRAAAEPAEPGWLVESDEKTVVVETPLSAPRRMTS